MKIKTLINKLSEYNQDAEVTLTTSEDIFLSYIWIDSNGDKLNKQNTPLVFIEPIDNLPDYKIDE